MDFVTDVSLNVMCGIIIVRLCSSEVYLKCPRLPWNKPFTCTQCNRFVTIYQCWTLQSPTTGITTPLYIFLQNSSVQETPCWLIVHVLRSGSVRRDETHTIRVYTSCNTPVFSDSRPLFIVLTPLGGVELGSLERTPKSDRSPTP